jgi:hypothetical protein
MDKIIVKNTGWLTLPQIHDGFDGILSVAEQHRNIPFDIKRIYYIYNLMQHKTVMRGKHAHKKLTQALFCIHGSLHIKLDDGTLRQEIELSEPNVGLLIGPKLWHIMHTFRNNCILLVFASDFFSEKDYIRKYTDFLKFVRAPMFRRTGKKGLAPDAMTAY